MIDTDETAVQDSEDSDDIDNVNTEKEEREEKVMNKLKLCDINSGGDVIKVFYSSLKEKMYEIVINLVKDGHVDVNHVFNETFVDVSHRGWTALHFVSQKGKLGYIKALLDLGADPSIGNKKGDTPLHLVSKDGNFKCVDCLLKFNDSLKDKQDLLGLTPLMKAIYRFDRAFKEKDYSKTIDLLIAAGCNVNLSPESNVSPLHVVAGKWKSSSMVQKLIKAGANVNADTGSQSPLMVALSRFKIHSDTVIALINAGADVNYKNPNGKSVLHIAVAKSEDICVDRLLKSGADPNCPDGDSYSPLWIAVCENDIKTAPLLIAHGGDVNFANKQFGMSLLARAVSGRSQDMVKLLLAHNADVNRKTTLGASPLHYAVDNCDLAMVKLLLYRNCDMDNYSVFKDIYNPQNVFQLALSQGDPELIKLIMQVGFPVEEALIKVTGLPTAVAEDEELVEWMYNYFYSPSTLLHLCRVELRKVWGSSLLDTVDRLMQDCIIPRRMADALMLQDLLGDVDEQEDEFHCI